MDERAQRSPRRRVLTLSVMALFLAVLSACGTGGGDDDNATEPAETIEAPTEETVTDLTGQPTTVVVSSPAEQTLGPSGTPASGSASPTPAVVVSAPPIVVPTAAATEPGTPLAPVTTASPVSAAGEAPTPTGPAGTGVGTSIGDGTGGAPASAPEAEVPTEGTPGATTPGAAVATSCDMPNYPPYTGDTPAQVTTSDVNFRAGPGADCDAIGGPIGAGVSVEVLSDPVTREGDDQFEWVAVTFDGSDGWLATEFLEPAPE